MKKSISILLAALALTGALTGCGNSASTSTDAQNSGERAPAFSALSP